MNEKIYTLISLDGKKVGNIKTILKESRIRVLWERYLSKQSKPSIRNFIRYTATNVVETSKEGSVIVPYNTTPKP
ncbi:MAG: hypothetical protein ACOC22_01945 [bacterium]